jgi:hypothetical protein
MLQVFIDPIGKYTKNFNVGAWAESTKKVIVSTEKVRAALAAAGQAKEDAVGKPEAKQKPKDET